MAAWQPCAYLHMTSRIRAQTFSEIRTRIYIDCSLPRVLAGCTSPPLSLTLNFTSTFLYYGDDGALSNVRLRNPHSTSALSARFHLEPTARGF
jgi:hypothetical protein